MISRTGTNRGSAASAANYLTFLGLGESKLSYEQYENDDKMGTWQGLGSLGDTTRPAITGITAVDQQIYSVEDQLATFKLAMTITTIASTVAAISGLLLLFGKWRK